MGNIALLLVAIATVLNGINVSIILKQLNEDKIVIAELIEKQRNMIEAQRMLIRLYEKDRKE